MSESKPHRQVMAEREEIQRRHEARPTPLRKVIDGWWWVRRTHRRVWEIPPWDRLRYRWQRSRRGWSERDVWHLDRHLAAVVAGSVRHLRDTTHGYPPDTTPESWAQTLTSIAEPLETYAADRPAPDETVKELDVREQREFTAAVEAMHTLASVFGHLWD